MAYKSLYRSYRPQTFDEVVGQEHIVQTLKNALKTGKIAHAYVFAGPRGTGKTTMAKLFAKALNCSEGVGKQCNSCENCKAIINGDHPDVLELDAASNNGVDEIRKIVDNVKYGTMLGKYKVYIIDEVHMLSASAFNALLKTLEEPPEHVIFILATTEPQEILPTILSRCQRYDFTRVSDKDMFKRLKIVLESEHITYEEEAIKLIISLADGGMRDALSILEQVLAYSNDALRVQDVLSVFALETKQEKLSFIDAIINQNVSLALDKLQKYFEKGTDIKRFSNDLLVILKDSLVFSSTYREDYLESLTINEAKELSKRISKEETLKFIDTILETMKDFKNVTAINPLFEMAILKLINEKVDSNKMSKQEKPIVKEVPAPTKIKAEEEVKKIQEPLKVNEAVKEEPPLIKYDDKIIYLKDAEREDDFFISDDLMLDIMVTAKKDIKKEIENSWSNIKKYLAHPVLGNAASLIIDTHVLVASNKIIILETNLPKLEEKINQKSMQADLQNVLISALNKKLFVYGISRSDSVKFQKYYMDAKKVDKLPKEKDINLEFIGD